MALLQTSALSVPAAAASASSAAGTRPNLRTGFVGGIVGRVSFSQQLGVQKSGSRVSAWFRFGKNGADSKEAGIYGSQMRDDFDKDDVEQVRSLQDFTLLDACVFFF